MLKRIKNLFKDERGQDMVEYALLASFIAVACIAILQVVGPAIIAIFQQIVNALS